MGLGGVSAGDVACGPGDNLRAASQMELVKNSFHVVFDGVLADKQGIGGFSIGNTLGH